MDILKKLLNYILPEDPDDSAGYGPFRLPSPECDWMARAATLHDWEFTNAEKSGKRLSEVDWELFYRWVLEAKSEQDPAKRCHRAREICRYWPLARIAGRYLWDG